MRNQVLELSNQFYEGGQTSQKGYEMVKRYFRREALPGTECPIPAEAAKAAWDRAKEAMISKKTTCPPQQEGEHIGIEISRVLVGQDYLGHTCANVGAFCPAKGVVHANVSMRQDVWIDAIHFRVTGVTTSEHSYECSGWFKPAENTMEIQDLVLGTDDSTTFYPEIIKSLGVEEYR